MNKDNNGNIELITLIVYSQVLLEAKDSCGATVNVVNERDAPEYKKAVAEGIGQAFR